MKFAAVYSLVVGTGMIGQWGMLYATKQIPELKTEPIRIWFHIAGEMITALALILGGIGLLSARPWAGTIFLIAIGMLFYTAIVSPGYFAQKREWGWLGFFSIIIILGLVSIYLVV